MATAAVRRSAEDPADSAHAQRLLIEDRRKVVLRGAGKHVGTIDQRKSPLMMAPPGGLHQGSVKFAVPFAIQSVVPDRVCRVQDALENDTFGLEPPSPPDGLSSAQPQSTARMLAIQSSC